MVPVLIIEIGGQRDREDPACCLADPVQEGGEGALGVPGAEYSDLAAAGEEQMRYVDGVGVGMLAQDASAFDHAAIVARADAQGRNRLAEELHCIRLDLGPQPLFEPDRHRPGGDRCSVERRVADPGHPDRTFVTAFAFGVLAVGNLDERDVELLQPGQPFPVGRRRWAGIVENKEIDGIDELGVGQHRIAQLGHHRKDHYKRERRCDQGSQRCLRP